jgi:aerobic-type carbon monoxide dehydrogenase small subunit (CoxS/CutS family)
VNSVHTITLHVNNESCKAQVPDRLLLADFVRQDLGLTGTHIGCEHGVCGACTVIVDGAPVRSCLMLAVQTDGCQVTTVEALAGPGRELNVLQVAFQKFHALQCGFCTSGILMSATAFLESNPEPNEVQVRDLLSGHICRCTGYQGIVDAVLYAAAALREGAVR